MPATRQSQRGCRSQKPHWALLLALSLSSHDRPAPASLGGRFSSLGSPLAAAVAAALPAHALDPAELPTVLEPLPPPAWSPTLCGSGVNPWDYGGGDLEEADEEPCWALDALPLELPPPPPAWAAAEPAEVTAALEAARASQGAVAEGTAEGPGGEGAAELRRQGSAAAAAAAATQAAFSQQSSAAGTAVMAAGGLSTPGGGDQGGDRVARLLQAMARVAYAQHPHPYKPTQRVLAAPPRPRGPLGPATGGRRSEGAAEEAIPASDFGVEERAAASGGPMERMAAAGDGEAFAALARLEALVAAFEADNLRAAQAQADVAVMGELEAGALRPAGGTPPAAAATPAAEVAEAMPAAATAASAADAGSRPEPANPAHVPPAFWPVLTSS
ncbi:hypothetical protein HYH03_006768 [Edaphochlamys debaryana]|uniref:Uncharacterized protein n=1 Tax=Edaphochlamys debaryana TaxID=47281 RepID=A0A836BZV8_9CHLO|nr:hypothetical protein HYH03_006768 [Edaphochlamys debaryana]|eukprot:KAG2495161.1 hypothetical protein HYH03_006768 [Edaphochlamys debaryana]